MKEFIEYIVKQLVDIPESVSIESTTIDENTLNFTVKVDDKDVGKVIGKHGNTINALRTLLIAVGAKGRKKVMLKIIEPPDRVKENQ
ncbi:MAG: KH domain-containing protein [Ignavibacteriaceae bacterium]